MTSKYVFYYIFFYFSQRFLLEGQVPQNHNNLLGESGGNIVDGLKTGFV